MVLGLGKSHSLQIGVRALGFRKFIFQPPERLTALLSPLASRCRLLGCCRGLLQWQAEARLWLDECRATSTPPKPPLGDGDTSMFDLREVFGGSGKVSRMSAEKKIEGEEHC